LQETYPRAFSYSSSEDVFVQQFLTAGSLADNLWLPLFPRLWRRLGPCRMTQQLSFRKVMTLGLTLGVGLTHLANITSSVFKISTLMSLFFGCGNLNVLPELSSLVGWFWWIG
jgi:hypothetical protein